MVAGADHALSPPFSRYAEYIATTAPPEAVAVNDGTVTEALAPTVTVCVDSTGRAGSTPENAPMKATTAPLEDSFQVAFLTPGSATWVYTARPSVPPRSICVASVQSAGARRTSVWSRFLTPYAIEATRTSPVRVPDGTSSFTSAVSSADFDLVAVGTTTDAAATPDSANTATVTRTLKAARHVRVVFERWKQRCCMSFPSECFV